MDTQQPAKLDQGTAYGRGPQSHEALTTEVGPGTPCGEFMRRYWQPGRSPRNLPDCPWRCASWARIWCCTRIFREITG